MGENLCDIFLKKYKEFLPIHGMIQDSYGKPKTPYQLDLEVKDRKPSIVPKVGDRVKIKSREWYEKWKTGSGYVNIPEHFTPPMVEFCGEVLTIEEFRNGRFRMKEDKRKWAFSLEMFEEVYPVQEQADLNPKTPYQLDLEVKDRKPSIVPKVGDKVKIKSREWYEKWKNSEGYVHFSTTDCAFAKGMEGLCGRELTVRDIIEYKGSKNGKRWSLSTNDWYFVPEMFEEVYPAQEQVDACFPKIDFNGMANFVESPLTVPPFSVKGGELIVAKTTVGSMIEDTAKRIAAYTSVQGLTAKPELKQIKTTRLIKLKKL